MLCKVELVKSSWWHWVRAFRVTSEQPHQHPPEARRWRLRSFPGKRQVQSTLLSGFAIRYPLHVNVPLLSSQGTSLNVGYLHLISRAGFTYRSQMAKIMLKCVSFTVSQTHLWCGSSSSGWFSAARHFGIKSYAVLRPRAGDEICNGRLAVIPETVERHAEPTQFSRNILALVWIKHGIKFAQQFIPSSYSLTLSGHRNTALWSYSPELTGIHR